MKLERLTESEKRLAEDNHNLVYVFLHRYKYSIEEYYNIVVFGYLKAVQIYSRRKDLQGKYDFPFIAWQYMRSEIGNYFHKQNCQKRKPLQPIISLDDEHEKTVKLYNIVGGKSAEADVMEKMLIADIMGNLTAVQRKIAELKIDDYNNKEVYLLLEIPSSTYYKEMQRMKHVVDKLIG